MEASYSLHCLWESACVGRASNTPTFVDREHSLWLSGRDRPPLPSINLLDFIKFCHFANNLLLSTIEHPVKIHRAQPYVTAGHCVYENASYHMSARKGVLPRVVVSRRGLWPRGKLRETTSAAAGPDQHECILMIVLTRRGSRSLDVASPPPRGR